VELPQPYLLFLGDVTEPTYAKTAFGLRDWARERCVGEWSCSDGTVTLGLPRLSPAQARTVPPVVNGALIFTVRRPLAVGLTEYSSNTSSCS
jgi:hypothetical protein